MSVELNINYQATMARLTLTIHLLDSVAIVFRQNEIWLYALIPRVHERTLHRAMAEA